jgi:hypothetical protein
MQLGVNNQGALILASNPVNYLRSKHIHVQYHAIQDFIKNRDIQTIYVPTAQMVADGLTKALRPELLKRANQLFRVC